MKWVLVLLLTLCSFLSIAQDKGIPTFYMNDPAVDLTRNGQLLTPDEVHELIQNHKGKFDISTLNPSQTSDLWKDSFLKDLPEDRIPVNDMSEVDFDSSVISPSGIFRFNIRNENTNKKLYTMMLSKSVHTVLLAKSLLRKLGYQIPDIKYLSNVVIKFKDESQKKTFLSYLENIAYAGSAKNWVVEDLGNKLILHDLVVFNSDHVIYNLAVGVTPDMIQGRRILSSLAVPLSIVHLSESVNMLRWNAGVISNKRVVLFHDNLEDFQCSWDDARWSARRIEKLTRDDWKDIVASTHIPKAVQQILLEKLISRRNSVMKLFKIDAEELSVNSHVNNGLELVDGKLTQEKWPGYASRFAFGDPESPLSDSDMKSWVKSRALSTAMELAIGQINQLPYLGTDIDALNSEKYKSFMAEAVAQSVLNQKPVEVPVKAWVFPTLRGNLILSRNLVTGTYLGTDNLVQLVDTVGVSMSAGLYAGSMGLSTPNLIGTGLLPITASGGAQANYVRTYAHLRPVINIKKSLKYPFKNILVPLVKVDLGKKLHEALEVTLDPHSSEDDRAESLERALKPFKEAINIGESLLVTDTLSTGIGAQGGANIYGKLLSASLGMSSGHIVLSRFHVHRKSEDDFHIYKDIGQKGNIGLNIGIDSLVPILNVSLKNSAGNARVKYFSLNLNKKNPDIIKNASALRKAIVHSSTRELEENDVKPYVIKHSFKEKTPSLNLFFWQFIKQNSATDFVVTNPKGDDRFFRRYYLGSTRGRNYQAYVNAVINHWVGLLFKKDAGLSDATGTNPGYSFKGQAQTKYLTLDQEVDSEGNVIEPFVSLNRIWNGWSIKKQKAQELLEEIRHRYRFQFYNAPVLNDTNQIFLYNISVNMLFYQKGIDHLLSLEDQKIKKIFQNYKREESLVINPTKSDESEDAGLDDEKNVETGVYRFLRLLDRFKKFSKLDKDDKAHRNLLKALELMERKLYLAGISELMGGDENIYVTSKISGFREGDEDGDRPLVSNSFGEFGSPRILGPVVQVQRQMDILEGEFFINWMMQRLI